MKIPISVNVRQDKLHIHRNGGVDIVDLPFSPYILAREEKFRVQYSDLPKEQWTKIPEYESKEYTRIEFNSLEEMATFKEENQTLSNHFLTMGYVEQLLITKPDFCFQYPHTTPLKILFFDIEVASKGDGIFPQPISNEILSIGYSIWTITDGSKTKINQKIITGFNDVDKDKTILTEFIKDIELENPDIIAGYNSDEFDIPYIIERAKIMNVDLKPLGKGFEPYQDHNEIYKIPGRIVFDIYNSDAGSHKDQSMFGIKSRTLKEVAKFYKIDITEIEVPEHLSNMMKLWKENPEKLLEYQSGDVHRTEFVGLIYIRNAITLAEVLGAPLSSILNMYSSFVPKLFLARNMEKARLINTESNFHKYNTANGTIAKLGSKFEGAIVGLFKKGFFPSVFKLDFASMYPSSICTWNLGPDTTTLVRVEDYTGEYKFSRDSKYNWYRIPDKNFNKDLIIKVDNTKEGFLKKEILKLFAERKKIRTEMKEFKSGTPEYESRNSQQLAIKIILNSIYGVLGLKSSVYGDMISGMMVTAMCRWTTMQVMKRYNDRIVEVDTDGYITDTKIDHTEANNWINTLISDTFQVENMMRMESEEFGRAYFYAMKNYVIQDGDRFIIHGSSIKSSRASKVVDRAVNLAIQHVFNNYPLEEVIREAYNFDNCSIEDFEERIKLAKDPREYDDQADMRLFLAKQVELKTKQVASLGMQINYVVCKNQLPMTELIHYRRKSATWNYTFSDYVTSKSELDISYYKGLIDKALDKFGISRHPKQLDLFLC